MSSGLILNTPLFAIEWRCVVNTVHTIDGVLEGVTELPYPGGNFSSSAFSPQNVKTVSQLVYQMNHFFRRQLVKLTTTTQDFLAGGDHHAVPADFAKQPANSDWYKVQGEGAGERASGAIEAIYRSDGKIGFKFTPNGQSLFVLRLSDEGKRIFGWDHRYIAMDANNRFSPYLTFAIAGGHNVGTVTSDIPDPNLTENVICFTRNPIFNHGHYRHEIAVLCSLPLQQYVECDQNSAQFKRQLASYRFPSESIRTEYRGTLFKVLKESRKNIYIFEHANKTHNVFLLTGTDLQNFHVRLMARNYTWSESKNLFIMDEREYPLPDDSLWTITLKVTPLE